MKNLNAKERAGDYEAIVTNITRSDVELLKNNVYINKVGLYKELCNSKIKIDNIEKNLKLIALDKIAIEDIFSPNFFIEEGRSPISEDEVIIDKFGKNLLGENIGDTIELNNRKYKVVGVYNMKHYVHTYDIELITFYSDINFQETVNAAFNLRNKYNKNKNIKEVSDSIGIGNNDHSSEKIMILNNLLYSNYRIEDLDDNKIESEKITEYIIYIIIAILTTFIIYGTINVSIKERIYQFSILRCIGATPRKIKKLVIKENMTLLIIAFIPGIMIGQVVCAFISTNLFNNLINIDSYGLTYKLYFDVIGKVILLTFINVAIATIIPIINIGKVSPIESINLYVDNKSNVKKGNSKTLNKILGYNGELAYKNIKANRKSFMITTIVSVLLLTTIIVFVGYYQSKVVNYKNNENRIDDVNINVMLQYKNHDENILNEIDKYKNKVNNLGVARNVFSMANYSFEGIFKDVKLNKWIKEIDKQDKLYGEKKVNINGSEAVYSNNINLIIMDDESLNEILPLVEDNRALEINDFKENGVLIANRMVLKGFINASKENIFNLKKEDNFTLMIKDENKVELDSTVAKEISKEVDFIINNNKEVNFKYLGSIDAKYIKDGGRYGFSDYVTLIVSSDFYNKNKSLFIKNKEKSMALEVSNINLSVELNKNMDKDAQIEIIKSFTKKIDGDYLHNKKWSSYVQGNIDVFSYIIYTIVFLLIIIGSINIINNKNVNMRLRKKEIGTLLAIGISKKRLRDILLIEGIIQWVMSSVISVVLSYSILKILFEIWIYYSEIEVGKMPFITMGIAIVFLLILKIIASYLLFRKIKSYDVIELIRNNE